MKYDEFESRVQKLKLNPFMRSWSRSVVYRAIAKDKDLVPDKFIQELKSKEFITNG